MTETFDADAVLRDDALLDALGRGELPDDFSDDFAVELLAGWREDVWLTDEATAHGVNGTRSVNGKNGANGAATVLAAARLTVVDLAGGNEATADDAGATSVDAADGSATDAPGQIAARAGSPDAGDVIDDGADDQGADQQDGDDRDDGGSGGRITTLAGWRRGPRSRRIAGAAAITAVVAIAVGSAGGVAAAAGTAEPGEVLWPITKVVYPERAESLEAAEEVRANLRQARRAASRGDKEAAQRFLNKAMEEAEKVRQNDGLQQLKTEATTVQKVITATPSPASSSPTAIPVPVPVPAPAPTEPPAPPVEPTTEPPPPVEPTTEPPPPPPTTPPIDPEPEPTVPTPTDTATGDSAVVPDTSGSSDSVSPSSP